MKKFSFLVAIFFVPIFAFAAESGGSSLLDAMGLDPKTIIIQAIGFIVVLLVLNKFVFGRVGELLEERKNEITDRMAKLESDQAELDRLTEDVRRQLTEMEAEANARIQSAIERGEAEHQRIVALARQESSAILDEARVDIDRLKEEAIHELRETVAEIAISAASQIIDQQLDRETHRHIVETYLNRIPSDLSQN